MRREASFEMVIDIFHDYSYHFKRLCEFEVWNGDYVCFPLIIPLSLVTARVTIQHCQTLPRQQSSPHTKYQTAKE